MSAGPSLAATLVTVAIHNCRKPTIVAINGFAIGVGITTMLSAAILVAYEAARIGFVFSCRGLVTEGASAYFLPKLVGYSSPLGVSTQHDIHYFLVSFRNPSCTRSDDLTRVGVCQRYCREHIRSLNIVNARPDLDIY